VREFKAVDINDAPELVRLVEEAHTSREPRILRRNGEDVAILAPIDQAPRRRHVRTKSAADLEAFRSSAGSWKDVDIDRLIADIYTSRERSTRPLVEL
jgi:hypothetical protein